MKIKQWLTGNNKKNAIIEYSTVLFGLQFTNWNKKMKRLPEKCFDYLMNIPVWNHQMRSNFGTSDFVGCRITLVGSRISDAEKKNRASSLFAK